MDKFYERLAWYLPRGLVYWCSVRLMSAATIGEHSNQIVPELYAMDALKRWKEADENQPI